MPLLDHFHPPLSVRRHWEAFHAAWAVALMDRLNQDLLPKDYFAEVQVHVGGRVEVDLGTFEADPIAGGDRSGDDAIEAGATATATAPPKVWAPPQPDLHIPAIFPDSVEDLVYSTRGGPTLVGAVELVSPGNKDRPESRRAFAARCVSYLQEGIGLIDVDIVTDRRANLHNAMVDLLALGDECRMPGDPPLYATAYRPTRRPDRESTDVWLSGFAVGESLPTLPLCLLRGPCLPIELEATYAGVRGRSRLA